MDPNAEGDAGRRWFELEDLFEQKTAAQRLEKHTEKLRGKTYEITQGEIKNNGNRLQHADRTRTQTDTN